MKQILGVIIIALSALFYSGCGGSGGSDSNKANVVIFGDDVYYVPNGVSIESSQKDVTKLSAGENGELASAVAVKEAQVTTSQAPVRATTSMALSELNNISISLYYTLGTVQTLTTQVFNIPFEYAQGEYTLTTYSATTTKSVRDTILHEVLGIGEETTSLEPGIYSEFNLVMTYAIKEGKTYFMVSVFPSQFYKEWRALATSVANGTNLASSDTKIGSGSDTFTGTARQNRADFLFVIDNSGSMSDNQAGVQAAADEFETSLTNSGISEFNIAIITTDEKINDTTCTSSYCAASIVNTYGTFNTISDFKTHVIAGSNGSSTETGIYNAEQSLLPTGILGSRNFPINSLSVIILSDEESQYDSRAGTSFDPYHNIFVSNGYKVYPIINPNDAGQYPDLAQATSGKTANIEDISKFNIIMNNIAIAAGGAASTFIPSILAENENAYIVHIDSVTINNVAISESTDNGYGYDPAIEKINFYGEAIPNEGDEIKVTYTYAITNVE